MDKKQITLIVVAVLVVAVLFGWLASRRFVPNAPTRLQNAAPAGAEAVSATKQEVPKDIVVPGEKAADLPANVAVPSTVAPAAPNANSSKREFALSVEGGAFKPDTVIVKQDDIAHISITAIDRDYDFTQPDLGLKLNLPKGQKKLVEAQFPVAGKYIFYCSVCGWPKNGPVGYIIVVPPR